MKSVVVLFFACLFGAAISAQRVLPPSVQLATLKSNVAVEVTVLKTGTSCGPYLQLESPANSRQPGLLAFLASWYEGSMKVDNLKYVKTDRVELKIIPGVTVPTAKLQVRGFEVLRMELSISPEDFKEASCLASLKGIPVG